MNGEKTKFNLGRVMALQKVRSKVMELTEIMENLGEPMLDDLSLVPLIYDTYVGFFRRRGMEDHASKVYHRKKLILILLFLYSPKALAGGKMRKGLRDRIASLFGLSAKTTISDNSNTAVCHYKYYRDFRRDVDMLLAEIVAALGDRIVFKD